MHNGCCVLQTAAQASAGRREIYRQLAWLDSALSSPSSFCILTPCSFVVIQLCQAAAECFPAELHYAGLCAAGDITRLSFFKVAGRHRCGSEQEQHAIPRLQSLTVSVGLPDPLKRQGMDTAALYIIVLHQPALPCTTLYLVRTDAHLCNPMHCLQPRKPLLARQHTEHPFQLAAGSAAHQSQPHSTSPSCRPT